MLNKLRVLTGLLALSHLSAAHPTDTSALGDAEYSRSLEGQNSVHIKGARNDIASNEELDAFLKLRDQWARANVVVEGRETDEEPDSTETTVSVPDEVNNEVVSGKGSGGSGGGKGGSGSRGGSRGGGGVTNAGDDDDEEDAAPRNGVGLNAMAALVGGWLLMAVAF